MEILGIVRILELNNFFDRLSSRPDTAEKNQGEIVNRNYSIEIQRGKKKTGRRVEQCPPTSVTVL